MRRRKGGDHSLAAFKSIRATRPDGAPIYIICDNLSANTTPAIRAWCSRNKVELCLTPALAQRQRPPPRRAGRPASRTRPHSQPTPAPLGSPEADNRSMTNPGNVHGQRTSLPPLFTRPGAPEGWPDLLTIRPEQ